jgi:hypothetical protein
VNLDAYPTTFFIGRDGRVKGVHAGFAAAATGEFNAQLRQEFTATIERLLAQKSLTQRVAALEVRLHLGAGAPGIAQQSLRQ